MIHYLVTARQDHAMRDYLDAQGRDLADRVRIIHYEDLLDAPHLALGTYIFAALEYLEPALRAFVVGLHGRLSRTPGVSVFNDPVRTLGRFDLLDTLARERINDFRVARATDDLGALRYPVFLRAERSHDGAVSPLLGSAREVDEAVARALLAGRRLQDLLVVEFCDTADARGYYRKYCAFVVGERVVPRRFDYGRGWMLKHEGSEFSTAMAMEERGFMMTNPHARELLDVAARAGVGYGSIDYGLRSGRVQIWEINVAPRVGPGPGDTYVPKPPAVEAIRGAALDRFYADFRAALEAVDRPSNGRAVAVDVDPDIVRAARTELGRPPRAGFSLARWLEPARPLLEPVATRVLPFVGRLVRRAGVR